MLFWIALFGGVGVSATLFGMWRAKKLMYAGLSFLVVLLVVAILFALSGASFVSVAQLVVYIGGILVLLLFGMLFMSAGNPKVHEIRPSKGYLGFFLVALLTAGLVREVSLAGEQLPEVSKENLLFDPVELGQELIIYQGLNFELVAVLLLVALLGAVFIASRA